LVKQSDHQQSDSDRPADDLNRSGDCREFISTFLVAGFVHDLKFPEKAISDLLIRRSVTLIPDKTRSLNLVLAVIVPGEATANHVAVVTLLIAPAP
jgi:hypothetical protein